MIDGFWWFIGAVFVCGVHAVYIRHWRRELRQLNAQRRRYDEDEQERHDEVMRALNEYRRDRRSWVTKGGQV